MTSTTGTENNVTITVLQILHKTNITADIENSTDQVFQ